MSLQRGQSMTEFAVCATVIALLLLGTITIAGFQEAQRRGAVLSRQMALQGAWLVSRPDHSASLQDIAQKSVDDPGLVDANGARLLQAADVQVQASAQGTPGLARTSAQAMLLPLQVAGGFLGAGFDLDADGLFAGSVNLSLQPGRQRPPPFDSIELELRQPFAWMADAWNASGISQVRSRTAGLVPMSSLSGIQSLWRPLTTPLALIEPSLAQLCLGIIEPDRVPEDRLAAGRTLLPGRCP